MGLTFLFAGFYAVSSVVIEVVDEDEEEYQNSLHDDRQGVKEGVTEDAPLEAFIPFPFTERLVQPPPYHIGSSEWKAFDKINRDPNLKTKMKSKASRQALLIISRLPANPSQGLIQFVIANGRK